MRNFLHKCTRDYFSKHREDWFFCFSPLGVNYIIVYQHFWCSLSMEHFSKCCWCRHEVTTDLISQDLSICSRIEARRELAQLQMHNACKHPRAQMFISESLIHSSIQSDSQFILALCMVQRWGYKNRWDLVPVLSPTYIFNRDRYVKN